MLARRNMSERRSTGKRPRQGYRRCHYECGPDDLPLYPLGLHSARALSYQLPALRQSRALPSKEQRGFESSLTLLLAAVYYPNGSRDAFGCQGAAIAVCRQNSIPPKRIGETRILPHQEM